MTINQRTHVSTRPGQPVFLSMLMWVSMGLPLIAFFLAGVYEPKGEWPGYGCGN